MKNLTNTFLKTLFASAMFTSFYSCANTWFVKPYVGLSNMSDITANAENVPNFSGQTDINLNNGFNAGLSGGYNFNQRFSLEAGWEYRSNDSETRIINQAVYPDGNYASNTFYLNSIYDFQRESSWQPYLGAGLVWVQEVDIDLELDGTELSYSGDGDIGYQIFAGVDYHINKQWKVQLEARYTQIEDIALSSEQGFQGNMNDLSYKPSTIQLGLIYSF